jgi:hypothetical protein
MIFDHIERSFQERPTHADAGIVDENVDGVVRHECFRDHRADISPRTDVTPNHYRSRANALKLSKNGLKPFRRAPATDDHRTTRRQVQCQAFADTVRCAGNQNDSIRKVHLPFLG